MTDDEFEDLCNLVLEIDESGADLPPKDQAFFESQKARIDRFGKNVNISPAQMEWLRDIHKRATR